MLQAGSSSRNLATRLVNQALARYQPALDYSSAALLYLPLDPTRSHDLELETGERVHSLALKTPRRYVGQRPLGNHKTVYARALELAQTLAWHVALPP